MKPLSTILALIWIVAMAILFSIPRSDFSQLWSTYSIAFAAYTFIVFSRQKVSLRTGLWMAVIIRLASLWFEPLLSDDYFRFIWDGMVSQAGIHPMAYTPQFLVDHPGIVEVDMSLFANLNSPEYYSVYPPVTQWLFRLSYWINGLYIPGHILFYKGLLIFTDAVICVLIYSLLKRKNLPQAHILWYALNPLIILEFAGNLHMDGLMIAGLLGAVWLSEKKNIAGGSASMVLSICTKMTTLLLIPFMPRDMYWKKIIVFSLFSSAGVLFVFGMVFGQHTGWLDSVALWFTSFEFNASFYYLARSIGYWMKGYNVIAQLGPLMALLSLCALVIIWIRYLQDKISDWSTAMLMVMTIYYLLGTTVHPWYIGLVLTLGILSGRIFPVAWTYLVMLSYSHYHAGHFQENYWLIGMEYLLLFICMTAGYYWQKQTLSQ